MPAGTLFVVATPIGNLEDITLRALRVLRQAQLVAAEDTRRTGGLLAHHGITTRTVSFHEHNSRERIPRLVDTLTRGTTIALVTDAGTPGISDPGVALVAACITAGIPVDPIPGVSAPLTAALASGFPLVPLTILGFPPVQPSARAAWFDALKSIPHTATFFEAPHRIQRTLTEVAHSLGERQIMVGRELTKLHQEFTFGDAEHLAAHLQHPKGEFTVVVSPVTKRDLEDTECSDAEIGALFGQMAADRQLTRRQTISGLAKRLGKPTKDVYAAVERAKKSPH